MSLPILSPSVLPPNPSNRILAILELVQGLNAMDVSRTCACFADETKAVQIYPEDTMKGLGRLTTLNKAGLAEEITKLKDILKEPELTISEVVESEATNKVVAHARGKGKIHNDEPYLMEFVLILSLGSDSNGQLKISELKVFVDTLHFQKMFGSTLMLKSA